MKQLSEIFLTAKEQHTITAAVQDAERQTSGEIVPMVVTASHRYPLAAASGGAFFALAIALLLTSLIGSTLWIGPNNMWLFLTIFALLYFPCRKVVNEAVNLKRLFLNTRQVDEEVREAAIAAFYREELYRTREENGVLIFISVLERRVWILGDRGIDSKIKPGQWQDIVNDLTSGIRDGRQAEVLCQAVGAVGKILKQHYPARTDDRDELHNIIIR